MSAASQTSPAPQSAAVSPALRTAEAKDAFKAALNSVGASIDTELQSRAKIMHSNAEALTRQEDQLRKDTKALAAENDAMQKLLDKTRKEVQDFGEVDPLLADLDADLALIEQTLDLAEESDAEGMHEDQPSKKPEIPSDNAHIQRGTSQN
ncbi:hypothetical protein HRR83_004093 [Exophiala dermatitidis]|uniref:Biogenesis of lysosome-related organelles complex 1 subunit 1 n=1 Tax=Exophiala dermatitidis TaxID=5970 RepID=A0AAN6EWF9_EXODE|nr:hypothetical protein HRR73_007736 [Exophiala dermatitidis]KAJ4517917.1 hypothetical protein HRR75_003138 [Exophiala dermatitidis]KAJ4521602.1 hypothetical protein HRR74_003427 [Exophiala dermatitidis]KAJ4533314.1 hypothetical protein HRR77_008664 [Exophiala dermatitidis]KAJ4545049.1 hypothetical protein HRR76_003079 [Exophiala dermatitidis]